MANSSTSTKLPTSKNIIYDSVNDTATGKKRAVEFTGGVSVAERARLFGAQVPNSSAPKNPPTQRPPLKNQPTKSDVIHQDRNYQPYKTDANQRPKQDTAYSSPKRVSHAYQPPPVRNNERPQQEPSSSINSHSYSSVKRPSNHQQQQRPATTYDTFQSKTPKKQPSIKAQYTQVIPGDSYMYGDDPFYHSQQSLPRNSNYFEPIQDPLQALYRSSDQIYHQQQMPMTINNNMDGMHGFDLGNLINRIQQDYLNNARPYVSSIQFIENEQDLANIGLITPSTTRKDYSRRNDNLYLRQGAAYHYDIIDTNNFRPRYTKPSFNNNQSSSMRRRKHRRRYHDQASSPINVVESIIKPNPPESPPPAPVQKPSTPVESSSSEEEEDTTTVNTKTEEAKTTEAETSEEEESTAKLPTPTVGTPALVRNEPTRPPLPNQTPTTAVRTPAKPVASETSESEESDSDSDSDSDEEEEKPKPSPIVRSNIPRTTPTTPQTTARALPPRTTTDKPNDTINQPPDSSNSAKSFDLQTAKKSSAIGGKFKFIANKFRRKKS